MRKYVEHRLHQGPQVRQRILALRDQRRKLHAKLTQVDAALASVEKAAGRRETPTEVQLDRWFRDLSAGLPPLPPIPVDFSRADLYADHD